MSDEPSLEVRAVAAERLTFFADAVIAIAITLLALDLYVPVSREHLTNLELLRDAGDHYGDYLAFVVSFMVIGQHWRGHHWLFRYVTKLGGSLAQLTLFWLLMQVITPFATRVLTGDGAFEARFVFYAGVQAVTGILFLLMVREIRRGNLLRSFTPPEVLHDVRRRSTIILIGFLISIPMCFVIGRWAYFLWALGIPISLLFRFFRRDRVVHRY
jgi:uncharacterized membrane protein